MIIEINMLKNYAPSNLNRDENGAPKTCYFGGVKRGRISSQCLKRSWRNSEYFQTEIGKDNIGIRTRKMPEMVAAILREKGTDEELIDVIKNKLTGVGNSEGKETSDQKTSQIIMYSRDDIEAIAEWVASHIEGKTKKDIEKAKFAKELQEALKKNSHRSATVDMALWGRMVTSDAFADVEASMRVGHAISTNKAVMESDFFTAVDDLLNSGEETGAGMMGDIDYTSSCYYMYSCIDVDKLKENLSETENCDEIVKKLIPVLVETMAYTDPSGKQNTFAAHSLPSAVLVEIKNKNIVADYSDAFEVPVRQDHEHGITYYSEKSLAERCNLRQKKYAIPVEKRLWFCIDDDIKVENAVTCESFADLIEALR